MSARDHRAGGARGGAAHAPARAGAQGVPADPARPEQHRHRLRDAGGPAAAVRLRRVARRRARAGRPGRRAARAPRPRASPAPSSARATSPPVPMREHARRPSRRCWRGAWTASCTCEPTSAAACGSTGGAPIQVIVNGVDANTARLIQGYVAGRVGDLAGTQARSAGVATAQPGRRSSSASGSTASCAAATSWCPA